MLLLSLLLLLPGNALSETRLITDSFGRQVEIPATVDRVICSGSGCLRLLTYLQAHDRIVAVDSIELRGSPIDARPYAIANPQFKKYPLFGEFRGRDNPELIVSLQPPPQVIFKVFSGQGPSPGELQQKTGIAAVGLDYGNLTYGKQQLHQSLLLMADIMGKTDRAQAVIAFFEELEQDLKRRTKDIDDTARPSCYIGGLGKSGPHGLQSTEPSFAPFVFTRAHNPAAPSSPTEDRLSHTMVGKEQIVFWDPEIIFIDISTMRAGPGASALDQLRTDPAYRDLTAVRTGHVYGLFPYNSYDQNFESIFANAYYVGKILYPERFQDIDPLAKAEEIATFLNGGPAFAELNRQFDHHGFSAIPIK